MRAKLDTLPAERYPALVALAPELMCAKGDGTAQYELGLDAMLRGLLPERPGTTA